MKSSMARSLVDQFSQPGDTIYDPFCGAGTVVLEGWLCGRHVVGGDLSPYAHALTRAKLSPPKGADDALSRLVSCWEEAMPKKAGVDLRRVPKWVRAFFHSETLREVIALRDVLARRRQYFLLACLLGILHHWRPGFLSYPSSHTVPFLLSKRYPRATFPELYDYRETFPRLVAKVRRAFAREADVDRGVLRRVARSDALAPRAALNGNRIGAIITSPPYMNSLSYARDNRLRLWFLGVDDHRELEARLSPRKPAFLTMMRALLSLWSELLPEGGHCVLVLGAVRREGRNHDLPEEVAGIVREANNGFEVATVCRNPIPDSRRTRINCRSTREDAIIAQRR
jgi:hypothetical protein